MAGGGIKTFLKSKTAKILLLSLVALLLLLAVWKVFFEGESSGVSQSEEEKRLCSLLKELDGVSDARAMITEKEGEIISAIVIFNGEDGILVRSRILDVTSSALGVEKGKVQVYPAKSSG